MNNFFQLREASFVLAASLSLAASGLVLCSTTARADTIILCTEGQFGCVTSLQPVTTDIGVGSDGEIPNDFGFGVDVSDGINFNLNVIPNVIQVGNGWTDIGGGTW